MSGYVVTCDVGADPGVCPLEMTGDIRHN